MRNKKTIKFVVSFLLIMVLIPSLSMLVSAETLFSYHTEWYNGRYFYEGSSMKYGVVMKVDTYNMHTNWTNRLSAAMSSWVTACGSYFTYSMTTSSPTVTYIGASSLPWYLDGNLIAITHLQDTNNVWVWTWSTGNFNNHGAYFKYADIVVNKYFDTNKLTADDRQMNLAHEMGHVAQLGHLTSSTVNSIMHGYPGTVGGYVKMTPQTKDKNDLINIYN